jgi:hypothetical protein
MQFRIRATPLLSRFLLDVFRWCALKATTGKGFHGLTRFLAPSEFFLFFFLQGENGGAN